MGPGETNYSDLPKTEQTFTKIGWVGGWVKIVNGIGFSVDSGPVSWIKGSGGSKRSPREEWQFP